MSNIDEKKVSKLIEVAKHLNISDGQLAFRIAQQIIKENEEPVKTFEELYNELKEENSKISHKFINLTLEYQTFKGLVREEIGFKKYDEIMGKVEKGQ